MRSIYSFIYSFFIYNMAQILKYSSGGTSPKPIKIGSKYYTKEQLMTDLYGDKLDEYIKFREFNSKEAANFRKNLNDQVDALINGSLTLEGNTLIDSQNRWSNNGEYAKPKLFGKLSPEQTANNDSLDVANYLVRALNSNKLSTYTAPSEYNLFESDTFKTYDNIQDDEAWLKESVDSRRNRIAKSLEDEAIKLTQDLNYRDKYSYEGWQDAEWDNRANATIKKLQDAASILKNPAVKGIDLKLQLNSLGYGDLMDLLAEQEVVDAAGKKPVSPVDGNGNGNGNDPESPEGKKVQGVSVGWKPRGPFEFSAPIFIYNGNEYLYGSPEYNKLVQQNPVVTLPDGTKTTIASIIGETRQSAKKIDKTQTPFYTSILPGYNYFSNVTKNFAGTSDLHSAYLLRRDALSPEGSILRLFFNSAKPNTAPIPVDYFFDPKKMKFYEVKYDPKTRTYIRGGERKLTKPIKFKPDESVSHTIKPTGNNDVIFNNKPNLSTEELYNQFSEYVKNNQELINKNGGTALKGSYLGSINRILEQINKGKLKNILGTIRNSNNKQIFIRTADGKLVLIYLNTPLGNKQPITYDNLQKIEVKKDGGTILKAQAGVKVDVQEENYQETPQTYEIKQSKTPKTAKTPTGKSMPISRKEQRLQEAIGGEFSTQESARLALSLIDLGSAVLGVVPGASALSTATGVASSLGTAVADYTDDNVSFWDATGNLVTNLGLDAVSLVPGLKALKVGKTIKFIGSVLPRAIGAFWSYGLIKDENQRNLLLSTGRKIAQGDFGKLNTQDFNNITTLIRMATLGSRDVASLRNRKKGDVVITGKVGGTDVKTTVQGDNVKGTLGRRMYGINPKFKSKAKKKLVEEANTKLQSKDDKGNPIEWKPDNIENFKIEVKPTKVEHKPKAFMENILGLENKGFNLIGSDKYLATHFPKFHRGMVTDRDVINMRNNPDDPKYAELNNYFKFTDVDDYYSDNGFKVIYPDRGIRDLINSGKYEVELNNRKAAVRKNLIEEGRAKTSDLTDREINSLANDVIKESKVMVPNNLKDLINQAKNSATVGEYFNKDLFKTHLLQLIRGYKQGGSIERGLSLINAYKSGGLVIPKFYNGGDVNDITYTGSPFLENVPDFTVFYGVDDLNKYFYGKNTPAQNSVSTFYRDHPELLNNGVTVNGKTYRQAEDAYKGSVEKGEFIPYIEEYLKKHTWRQFNDAITKLREYRKRINNLSYGDELKGSPEDQKKLQELIGEFNKDYTDILGPIGGKIDKKQFNRNGGATLERHIAFLTSQQHADRRNFKDKDGTEVFLDNAFFLNPGTYPTTSQNTNTTVNGAGGAPAGAVAGTLTDGNGKTGAKPGDKTGGARTGSWQYISDLFKPKTRPNPIQWLRMAELAGALGTNAKATDELLKYRSYNEDAPYKLAYLYGNYPLIAAMQNQVGSLNTQTSIPTAADLGSYFSNRQTGFSKGLTAMQNIYGKNYDTYMTSKAGVQEAINTNDIAQTDKSNKNTARAVTAENMKHKAKADLYSANFAQGIKPFLSETRQYMQDAAKLRQKAEYDVQSAIAKQKYDNDIAAINENYVKNIKDAEFLKANEGKSDYAIIQAWLAKHPKEINGYKALLETPTMDYYKSQAKLYEILAPNIGFLNSTTLAYNFESGGKLTAKDRMKIQKVKDYNAARRQDSKESLKSITKDKEEFGKNYRAMSAGTLKMLERTLK